MKLKLNPNPTFKHIIDIPIAGSDEPAQIEFTFKAMTQKNLHKYLIELGQTKNPDVEALMDIASGWNLEEVFSAENVQIFDQNYIGAAGLVFNAYINELTKARLGN